LSELLRSSRTIAVVGLSGNAQRPSRGVAAYLQRQGYRILPVNPALAGQRVLGELCVAALEDLHEPVDIVDVFRRSEDVLPLAQAAVSAGARCLWQQVGVANTQADEQARAAGLVSVMDRCLKVEHARLLL
jgi:predicted CoA-binding protein